MFEDSNFLAHRQCIGPRNTRAVLVVEVLFFTGADAFCGKRLLTAYDWCEICAVETVRYEEEMIDGIPRG
jgi:hypothetical protein